MLQVSEEWLKVYPGAKLGIMAVRRVANPQDHEQLRQEQLNLEQTLRNQFKSREDINAFRPVPAYSQYYRRFNKTYHVSAQIESVALKGKAIPSVAALVEAMFMAELKSGLLTAGHDLKMLAGPLFYGVANGNEVYTRLNGQEQAVKAGDMILSDSAGIIGSIIYGPDKRTRITSETVDALFVIYAPPGIETADIEEHLTDIAAKVKLIAPMAEIEFRKIYKA